MKITLADRDLTEFDWPVFIAAWLVAIAVVVFQPRALVVLMMVLPLILYARQHRQRVAEAAGD